MIARARFGVLAALFLVAACAGPRPVSRPRMEHSFALLPLESHVNDIEAPDMVRATLREAMEKRGWRLLPDAEVEMGLGELGVHYGGQLTRLTPMQIGEKLSVDALIYGELLDFNLKTVGVLTQRRVQVRLRVVEASTGRELWKGEGVGVHSTAGADAVADAAIGLTGKAVSIIKNGALKLLPKKTPGKGTLKKAGDLIDELSNFDLRYETREAAWQLVRKIEKALGRD